MRHLDELRPIDELWRISGYNNGAVVHHRDRTKGPFRLVIVHWSQYDTWKLLSEHPEEWSRAVERGDIIIDGLMVQIRATVSPAIQGEVTRAIAKVPRT